VHFQCHAINAKADEMLYQDRTLGRHGWAVRMVARVAALFGQRRYADLDILSMSPHLRRDLGIEDGQGGLRSSGRK